MTKGEKRKIYGLIRDYIALRDGEICLKCKRPGMVLSLSHIYPKGRYRSMELEPLNIKFLCYACHIFFWHRNPIEAHEWLQTAIPKERLAKLKLMAQTQYKAPKYPELKLWLESEIKRMKRDKLTGR